MEGKITLKKVNCNYLGNKELIIHCDFYYENSEIYFLRLDALLKEGEFINERCNIYAPGMDINQTSINRVLMIEHLNCNKMEIVNVLKVSMIDVVMFHLNKEPDLHEYRVGFMVS